MCAKCPMLDMPLAATEFQTTTTWVLAQDASIPSVQKTLVIYVTIEFSLYNIAYTEKF